MTRHDDAQLLDRFNRRLAAIEAEVPSPPRWRGPATTQSPEWRFQSMFSATKFVVAGAIVALLGGFLLAGVLTQPSEESVPAAGASASASAVATPPDEGVSTLTPEPTPPSPVLPGTELDFEQVAPGVFQVHGDGVRDLTAGVRQVVVAQSGDVWVEIGGDRNSRVVRLGEPGVSYDLGSPRSLGLSPDGAPLIELAKRETLVFDGEGWVASEEEVDPVLTPCDEIGADHGTAALGSCWIPGPDLKRYIDGSFEVVGSAELGIAESDSVRAVAASDFGLLWATVHDEAGRFSGLLRYNGETGTRVPYEPEPGYDVGEETSALVVGPDGRFWVQRAPPFATNATVNNVTFTTWDGDTWTSYGPVEHDFGYGGWDRDPAFGPNGTVWFYDGQVVFDGEAVRRSGLPEGRLVQGPTSTFWKKSGLDGWASRGPLLAIDPKAVAAAGTEAIERPSVEEGSTTTPDLLPGVDLVTEEVEPGVYRVVHDGVHGLRQNVWDVSVTTDGSVWVEKHTPVGPCFGHTAKNSRVLKLGTPGIAVPDIKWDMQSQREPGCQPRVGPRLRFGIVRGVGPVLLRHEEDNREVFVHEDDGWSAATRPAVVACALKADYGAPSLIARDGACWARPDSAKGEAEGQVLAQRVDAGGELTIIIPEDVGTEGGLTPVRFATDPDGTVWTGLHTDGSFAGLAGFDGQQWTDVPLTDVAPRVSPDARVVDLVATSDGSVWVAVQGEDRANTRIVRWDGQAWTDRGLVEQAPGIWPMPRLFATPDDSVWLDGRFRFHGDGLKRIDLPTGVDAPIVSHAPDGSIWVADGGLYVISPEALSAGE